MGLTEAKIKELQEKGFDRLFERDAEAWQSMADTAFRHTQETVTNGNAPRPDDVFKILHPTIEVNGALRRHQEDNRARGKRFVIWFTEYIIDKYFSEKERSDATEAGETN